MGTWEGLANTYGADITVTESYDCFTVTTEGNPSPNQSVGGGEWDPFPIPPELPNPETPERDVTRYRKGYSSQRMQVQRIRYSRRRT